MADAPIVLSGSAHPDLAHALREQLGVAPTRYAVDRFPDGETRIDVQDSPRHRDVVIVQPTARPVGDNLLELALLADACHRSGARTITAVIPYFGYARQDRRQHDGEALGVRVVCELLSRRFARVIAVDLHSSGVETALDLPLVHFSATALLAEALRSTLPRASVVVAPDLGAARLARRIGELLDLPVAIVHKQRLSGTRVDVHGIVGDVRDLTPVIVDDMISTGGTIEAAARVVRNAGARAELVIATTHALLVGPAIDRLAALKPSLLVCTDTVPQSSDLPFRREVVSIAPLLADAIRSSR